MISAVGIHFIIDCFMSPFHSQLPNTPSTLLVVLLKRIAAAFLLLGLAELLCVAQDPSPAAQQRPRQVHQSTKQPQAEDTLRIDTDLVSVDVNVADATGRTVRNLDQKDFKLFEDGNEQSLAFFHVENKSGETRPLAIVF